MTVSVEKKCPIDDFVMQPLFRAEIMRKYDVQYYYCSQCSLIQTEQPFWLDEAYSRSLAECDTGLMERNLHNALRVSAVVRTIAGTHARVVDVAGGYGILTRLLRDIGFDCVWDDKYSENIIAPGFESIPDRGGGDVCCAFEVLEHIEDPVLFMRETEKQYGCRFLLFSTELFCDMPDRTWPYYAFNTGQHISFYSRKTLKTIANSMGWSYQALPRNLHLFSAEPIRLSQSIILQSPLLYLAGGMTLIEMRKYSKTQSDSIRTNSVERNE